MRGSTPAVRKEIVATIEAQLAAFRAGDIAQAHSLASTLLRRQRPLAAFATIVEQNYPEIWSNTGAEFGLARDDGEQAAMVVLVQGVEKKASYDFFLVKERVGWRISGVLKRLTGKGGKV